MMSYINIAFSIRYERTLLLSMLRIRLGIFIIRMSKVSVDV